MWHQTFVSVRSKPTPVDGPIDEKIQIKPEISNFTRDGVVFKDGTTANVDAILLATGYELRFPFLDEGGTVVTDPFARSNTSHRGGLVTNLRYMFPLHQHILSLCPSHPTNALAFIGLPTKIANCPSDIAQSLYALHAFLNGSLLPSRGDLLKELAHHEQDLRSHGYDPYTLGHRLVDGTASDYQDGLVAYLKKEVCGL